MKRTLTEEKSLNRFHGSVGKVENKQKDSKGNTATANKMHYESTLKSNDKAKLQLTDERLEKLRKLTRVGDLMPYESIGQPQTARSGGGSTSSRIERGVRLGLAKKLLESHNGSQERKMRQSMDKSVKSDFQASGAKMGRSVSLQQRMFARNGATGNGLLTNQALKSLQEEPEDRKATIDASSVTASRMSTLDRDQQQCMSHCEPFKDRVVASVGGGLSRDNRCKNGVYSKLQSKIPLCKNHFLQFMRSILAKGFYEIYRHPDLAYQSMDKVGQGWVEPVTFANSIGVQKLIANWNQTAGYKCKISTNDVKQYALASNLFAPLMDKKSGQPNGKVGLKPGTFKKAFFPHLCHGGQDTDAQDGGVAQMTTVDPREQLKPGQKAPTKNERTASQTLDRITHVEKALRLKFGQKFDSVKKAFLFMDADHDGYITIEDFLRNFSDIEVSYDDLSKLMRERDSKHIGRINYQDFSAWVGNCIHQSEGFFFRHDSVRNPQYERNLERQQQRGEHTERAKRELSTTELRQHVILKIRQQWTSILKAFKDMNKNISAEGISPPELKFYLNHWGFKMPEVQFKEIYDYFDVDRDGKISYQDFNLAVGHEIHPGETAYFRQDTLPGDAGGHREGCKHPLCWQETIGAGNFCTIHIKMHMEEVKTFYQKIYNQVGEAKWNLFKEKLRKYATADDNYNSIEYDKFEAIFYRILSHRLTQAEHEMLFMTNGRVAPNGIKFINVQQVYAAKQAGKLKRIYDQLKLGDNTEDDAQDAAGFTGNFQRDHQKNGKLKHLPENVLFQLFASNKHKMNELMRTIFSIDVDRNGYVTQTEIDDILRLIFNAKQMKTLANTNGLVSLDDYELKPLYRPFASSANRVLIDYKQFRDYLAKGIQNVKDAKSRNEIVSKQATADSVNKRINSLKNKMEATSPMIRLKRSSDLLPLNQRRLNDFNVIVQGGTDRESEQRSFTLNPRSINMKNNLSAALMNQPLPGRLNEITSNKGSQLPNVPSARNLHQKDVNKLNKEYSEMVAEKFKPNGSQISMSQQHVFQPRASLLEKSQSEAMLRNDLAEPSFASKLSMANLRAANNFSSTLQKPSSQYKAHSRLFDPSHKIMAQRLNRNNEELRSMSPFDIQPGQPRFTKALVNSISQHDKHLLMDVMGSRDLAAEVYNDEDGDHYQSKMHRRSTIEEFGRDPDVEAVGEDELMESIRRDSLYDEKLKERESIRKELLQSINGLPKDKNEFALTQQGTGRPKTMQRQHYGSNQRPMFYSEQHSDDEETIVNEYYGSKGKIPTSMPNRASHVKNQQNFVSKQSTTKLPMSQSQHGKFVTDPTVASQITRASQKQSTLEQSMKDKLSYDWKTIYRRLHANDVNGSGKVSVQQFEKTLQQTNTFLSREDISLIKTHYGVSQKPYLGANIQIENQNPGQFDRRNDSIYQNGRNMSPPGGFESQPQARLNSSALIDYDELSASILGSHEKHREKFDVMRRTHSKLNQIKMKLANDEAKLANEYRLMGENPQSEISQMRATGGMGKSQFRTPIKLTHHQQMRVLNKHASQPPEKFKKTTLNHEPRDSSLLKQRDVFKRNTGGVASETSQRDLLDSTKQQARIARKTKSYLKINVKNEK